MITLVVAHDSEGNIGKGGELPWGNLPNDMLYFKGKTVGKIVVMGRKTYESIGRPLPDRENFIITKNAEELKKQTKHLNNVTVVGSIDEVITIYKYLNKDVYVIGGAEIYNQMFPHADRVLYTEVHGKFEECDTQFPDPYTFGNWQKNYIGHLPADENNDYAVTFYELVREEKPWESKLYSRFI
jgi:dihydrofolate reductase